MPAIPGKIRYRSVVLLLSFAILSGTAAAGIDWDFEYAPDDLFPPTLDWAGSETPANLLARVDPWGAGVEGGVRGRDILLPDGRNPARLGGNYWEGVILEAGQEGRCFLNTRQRTRTPCWVESPDFTLDADYLRLRVGGGGGVKTRVILRTFDCREWEEKILTFGPGTWFMRTFTFDVKALRGRKARLRIVDESDPSLIRSRFYSHLGAINQARVQLEDTVLAYPDRKASPGFLESLRSALQLRDYHEELPVIPPGRGGEIVFPWITVDQVRTASSGFWFLVEKKPVWGMADIHTHLFAQRAMDGRVMDGHFQGEPEDALHCHHSIPFNMELFHFRGGWPYFEGWPAHTTLAHQMAYAGWLRRAWKGGLRLVMADALNCEALAALFAGAGIGISGHGSTGIRDDDSIRSQLELARWWLLEQRPDWAELALTPADARRIIAEGKLAVVLGIEVDRLAQNVPYSGQAAQRTADLQRIMDYLESYRQLGVRHIIPVHLADNRMGGSAVTSEVFYVLNRMYNGTGPALTDGWGRGIHRKLEPGTLEKDVFVYGLWASPVVNPFFLLPDPVSLGLSLLVKEFIGFIADRVSFPNMVVPLTPAEAAMHSHRNAKGLSDFGKLFIEAMMRKGMLVDLDHMSDQAKADTLTLAKQFDYPLMASHTGMRALSDDLHLQPAAKQASERSLHADQVQAIRDLGGVVGLGTVLGGVEPDTGLTDYRYAHVPYGDPDEWTTVAGTYDRNCMGSSLSFLQQLRYLIPRMSGAGVCLGTDINGFDGVPSPRFGTDACHACEADARMNHRVKDQARAQKHGVRYDLPMISPYARRFWDAGDHQPLDGLQREFLEGAALAFAKVDKGSFYKFDQCPEPWCVPRDDISWGKISGAHYGWYWATCIDRNQPNKALPGGDYSRAAFKAYHGYAERTPWEQAAYDVWEQWMEMGYHDWQTPSRYADPVMSRCVEGVRDFDLNLDGMAHYGLLPDFVQDLKNVGATDAELSTLFGGAEAFIRTWERAEARAAAIANP